MKRGICMVIAAMFLLVLQTSALKASSFTYYDDPFTPPILLSYTYSNPLQSSEDINVTYQITNNGSAHDVGFIVPIFQYEFPNGLGYVNEGLIWNQSMGGWYNPNVPNIGYAGLGLLITVTSPSVGLPFSEVADQSGINQQSFTYLGQTTNPSDSYPFIDLGVLQAGQSTTTTVTYHWAWTNCPPTITCQAYHFDEAFETIASNPYNTVPEPSTLLLLGTGLLGVVSAARRKSLG